MGVTQMIAFRIITLCRVTQGGSGGNVRILTGNNIGHCEAKKKKVNMNTCLLLNDYRDEVV